MMDERVLERFVPSRRNLITGGLMAATAAPWIAGSSAMAASHLMYPRVGHRILVVDNRVFGLGACHTDLPLNDLSADIQAESVEFSDDLVARLLQVSLFNGDDDPRTVQLVDRAVVEEAASIMLNEETVTMARLRDSRLYWVQTNPVFLYAVGGVLSMCLYPFVQGFFSQLGSRVADWLWERIVEQ